MTDAFSATSSALPPTARVVALRGTEALSALYSFEIYLLVEDPAFDMAAALGADATLAVHADDGQRHAFHGILASVETVDDAGQGALYRLVLVPRLWRLTLGRHSRVFVDETAPGILQTVLHDAGFLVDDYTLRLSGTYARQPHVCQYRESSVAFLSRRMEREGIYYFFEQGEARERLVITDDRSFHAALPRDPVRYFRVAGPGAAGAAGLASFVTCKHSVDRGQRPRRGLRLHSSRRSTSPARRRGLGLAPEEVHLYGENFVTPEEGARLARLRAEELLGTPGSPSAARGAAPSSSGPATRSRWRTTRASTGTTSRRSSITAASTVGSGRRCGRRWGSGRASTPTT